MHKPSAVLVAVLMAAVAFEVGAKAQRWSLDFQSQTLDRLLIPQAIGRPQSRWYATYVLTNNTGADRDVAFSLFVETDVAAGRPGARVVERHSDAIDPLVQQAVEARTGRRYLDSVQVQGRLRAAEKKEALAVFGPLSPEADRVTLYAVGLSSAVEESRLGADYERMIRGGREVWAVVRGKTGAYDLKPVARRISPVEYAKLVADEKAKVQLWRTVNEADGEACYVLDDERLTAAEPRRYLERLVLRRRYARSGDEVQPQLDQYRFQGEDWILAIEPLAPAVP